MRIADWGDLKSGRRKAETKLSDLCVSAVKKFATAEVLSLLRQGFGECKRGPTESKTKDCSVIDRAVGTNPARSAKIILPEADIRLGRGRFEGANRPYRA